MIVVQAPPQKRRRFATTWLPWSAFALVALAGTVLALNWAFIQRPVATALANDARNSKVTSYAYARWGVDPTTLVIDIHSIAGEASMVDVSRVLMQTASALKERRFARVQLAYRGQARFMVTGDYFQTMGRGYGTENPLYTIRTMPENVFNLDGTPAFGTWTGGLFGVLAKQMEESQELHRRWYMDRVIADGRLR